MLTAFAAESKSATTIGAKTAGTYLARGEPKVGSGYWPRLPVFGWYTAHGACVDGQGAAPDIPVEVESD